MKYVIADLHFSDVSVLRTDSHPFANVEEMDATLLANWRCVVQPADEVYILGDLTLSDATTAQGLLNQLPGRKTMIRGNHDRFLSALNFDTNIFENVATQMSFKENHHRYQLCHYPLLDYPGMWHHQRLLYGHVHSNHRSRFVHLMSPDAVNVSASEINFTPISVNQLETRITAQWQAKVLDMVTLNNVAAGRPVVPSHLSDNIHEFDQDYCQTLVTGLAFNLLEVIWLPSLRHQGTSKPNRIMTALLDQVPIPELTAAETHFKSRYAKMLSRN
jgi:calcineurin-like phosphoesterase family protein